MPDFAYYYALRNEARRRTVNALNKRIQRSGQIQRWDRLTICSISEEALRFAAHEWPKFYGEAHHHFITSWEKLFWSVVPGKDFFDVAIWQNIDDREMLVAMALGNPSHGRTHLTMKRIERFLGPSHLEGRVLWPVLTCAEEYAKLLGGERVLIKSPVDSSEYEKYGYEAYRHPHVAYGGCYIAKEVRNV